MPAVFTNDIFVARTTTSEPVVSATLATQGGAFASVIASYHMRNMGGIPATLRLELVVQGDNGNGAWIPAATVPSGDITAGDDSGTFGTGHIPVGGYAFLQLEHRLMDIDGTPTGTAVLSTSLNV